MRARRFGKLFVYHIITPLIGVALWCAVGMALLYGLIQLLILMGGPTQ